MALQHSPRIVTDGLILVLDAGNTKSYPGSGTTWTDLIGSNDGTLTNGTTFSSANGGVFEFDGTDDTITITYTPDLAFTNSILSCEAWIYIDSLSSNFPIVNKRGNNSTQNTNRPYVFEVRDDGTLRWILDGASTVCDTATDLIQTGQWYHLAATHDGTNAKIYVNGVLNTTQSSGTSSLNDTADIPTRIGWRYQNSSIAYGDGNIAILRFYNKSLTAAEVLQNYDALKGRYV